LRFLLPWTTLGYVVALCLVAGLLVPVTVRAETYVQFAKGLVSSLPTDSQFRDDLENQLAKEANSFRSGKGVKPLTASKQLQLAARAHAVDMMLNNFVGHRSSRGQEFDSRMSAFLGGGRPMMMLPRMGENAARDTQKGEANSAKASRLFQQWVDSRPHRKALLNGSYRFVSTGVVQRGNKIYAVQIFWSQIPKEVEVFGADPASEGIY
jgi:uncharacterized protein YkwD